MKSGHKTVEDRRSTREAPKPHFERVAKLWGALLGIQVTAEQVILCMVALKLGREAGQHDPDNITDAEGYLSLISEVRGGPVPPLEEAFNQMAERLRAPLGLPGVPHS